MVIFSWVMLVVAALLGVASLAAFLLGAALDVPVWYDRSKLLRRLLGVVLLFWFNVWVWGRVVWTLFHW